VIDNVAFYQTSIGFSIRTLGYEFSTDGYNSNDVTIFSPHLFEGFINHLLGLCRRALFGGLGGSR
jgi:hypothetical protein